MTFTLKIRLGNSAMSTWVDIANAVRSVADDIPQCDEPATKYGAVVMDDNGNRVGEWSVS